MVKWFFYCEHGRTHYILFVVCERPLPMIRRPNAQAEKNIVEKAIILISHCAQHGNYTWIVTKHTISTVTHRPQSPTCDVHVYRIQDHRMIVCSTSLSTELEVISNQRRYLRNVRSRLMGFPYSG